jgi:hypothetical protein
LCLRLLLFWLLSLHSLLLLLLLLLLLFFRFFCHSCIGFHDLQFSSFASRKFRNYYFPQARLFAAHQTQSPAPAPAPAYTHNRHTPRALLLKSQAEAAAAINPNSTKLAQTNKTQQQKRRKMGGDAQAGVVFFFHNCAMGTASAHTRDTNTIGLLSVTMPRSESIAQNMTRKEQRTRKRERISTLSSSW